MSVPILDEAYMERARQSQYFQAMADSFRRPDTTTSLREEYALGKIDYAELARRLERLLRCT